MMSEQSVGSAGRGSAGRDLSQRGSAGRPARPALAVRDEDTMDWNQTFFFVKDQRTRGPRTIEPKNQRTGEP